LWGLRRQTQSEGKGATLPLWSSSVLVSPISITATPIIRGTGTFQASFSFQAFTMAILRLPLELFEQIIKSLVDGTSVEKVIQHRVVCSKDPMSKISCLCLIFTETFNRHIIDSLLERATKLSFSRMFRHSGYNELFKAHGGSIIAKRVLSLHSRRQPAVINSIRRVVAQVFNNQRLHGSNYESLRTHYTYQFCRDFMAIEPQTLRGYLTRKKEVDFATYFGSLPDIMPAIAATLDNPKQFSRHMVSHTQVTLVSSELFPSALDAAVASGNTALLSVMLECIKKNVKGKPQVDTWDEIRAAARNIGKALRLAIRLH
jgi:hypothetical protein